MRIEERGPSTEDVLVISYFNERWENSILSSRSLMLTTRH